MKHYFIAAMLASITFNAFSQEKNEIRRFVNPPETKPRFIEDINLSKSENKKSFNKKIRTYFHNGISRWFIKDSIKTKVYLSFKIDTLGNSTFHKIYPKEFETQYLKKEISTIINSLPIFIPATQRNKKATIIYVITLFKNE